MASNLSKGMDAATGQIQYLMLRDFPELRACACFY